MTSTTGFPDFATMRRTIEGLHDGDFLDGLRCSRNGCRGPLHYEGGRLVCEDCGDVTARN